MTLHDEAIARIPQLESRRLRREDRLSRFRQVNAMVASVGKRVFASLTRAASIAARLVFADVAVAELGLELGQPARL
jgi:hypothetical protein